MRYLRELVHLLTRISKKSTVDMYISPDYIPENKSDALFKYVYDGKISSDKDAVRLLYGVDSPAESFGFIKLKSRAAESALSTILLLEEKKLKTNDYNKAAIATTRNLYLITILQVFGAHAAYEWLAKNTLKTAIRYHLSQAVVELSSVLTKEYLRIGDGIQSELYNTLKLQWLETYHAESTASSYIDEITVGYLNTKRDRTLLLAKLPDYSHKVQQWRQTHGTYKLFMSYVRILSIMAEENADTTLLKKLSNEAEEFFTENPQFLNKVFIASILTSRMNVHTAKGEYQEAYTAAEECQKYLVTGTYPWFTVQESMALLALRSKRYDEAVRIVRSVSSDPRFEHHNPFMLSTWRLIEFYTRFASREPFRETTLPRTVEHRNSRFRFFKEFVYAIPAISNDNTFYVMALFAHVIILASTGDKDMLIQRAQELDVIRQRKLNKKHPRAAVFSRMINLAVQCDFNTEQMRKRAEPILEELQNHTTAISAEFYTSIEIIPFEELWEILLREIELNSAKK